MPEPSRKKRSHCPINFGLEIFGDRWTLLILRDLLLRGRRHFQELLSAEEGIASNILTERLKRLEQLGLISRRSNPDDRRRYVYAPTDKGQTLVPVLLEIAAWGATHDPDTGAPPDFAPAFYADREALIANYDKIVPRD
jgi:DNA-binding HxlR family transcriptional regulator